MGFGTLEFGPRKRAETWVHYTLLRFIFSLGLIGWAVFMVFQLHSPDLYYSIGGLLIYILLGYFVHPKPNWQDMGCFGTLFNNPFSISDNFNRGLFFILLLLFPARFISESFVDFTHQVLKPYFRQNT